MSWWDGLESTEARQKLNAYLALIGGVRGRWRWYGPVTLLAVEPVDLAGQRWYGSAPPFLALVVDDKDESTHLVDASSVTLDEPLP